jgi:hypothetical protein
MGGRHRDFGHAAEPGERGHAVAGGKARSGGRRAYDAAHLGPGHERRFGLELVEPAALQHVGKRDRRGADLDDHAFAGREHVIRLGLGDLGQLEGVGAGKLGDLKRTHGG